ncbi:aldolase/citrate lyase family protein [Cupriavidus basilensis]
MWRFTTRASLQESFRPPFCAGREPGAATARQSLDDVKRTVTNLSRTRISSTANAYALISVASSACARSSFVPADSDRKLASSLKSAADGLVFDLEDAIPESGKDDARRKLVAFLARHRASMQSALLIRVNGLASGHILRDLAAVIPAPAKRDRSCRSAVVGRRCASPLRLPLAAFECALLEGTGGRSPSSRWRLPESSESVFGLSSYRNAPRAAARIDVGRGRPCGGPGCIFIAYRHPELTAPFSVARTHVPAGGRPGGASMPSMQSAQA